MRSTLLLALLASTAPLAAPVAVHAQGTPQDRQRQFELDQRFEQQRIERLNADIERQMATVIRDLTPAPAPVTPPPPIIIQRSDERTRQLQLQVAALEARLKAMEEAAKAEKKPAAEAKPAAKKP